MYRTHAACPFKHWNLLHSSEGFLPLQYLNISITASVNIDVIRYCFSFFFFQFKFVMMLEFFQEVHVCNKPFHTDSLSQESFWNTSLFAHIKGFRLQSLLYHLPKTPLLFFPWQTTSYTPISFDVENWMTTLMESQYQIFLGSRTQTMPASATTPILLWKTLSLTLCQCPSLAHPGTNVNEKQWEWVCC